MSLKLSDELVKDSFARALNVGNLSNPVIEVIRLKDLRKVFEALVYTEGRGF